ncbi:MAG TPA: porin [Vicinamibacteria bacterium]|nr:porin [Vicinamibacteria bacterium]
MTVLAALGLALAAMAARAEEQASQPAPAPLPTPLPPVKVAAEPEGFVVQSADGNYRLQFNSIVQADGRFYENDPARLGTDTFLLRSARPILQGTVASRFDVYLAPDFGQGQSLIQDAYVEGRFSPWARLRVGKFKTPFGLERLILESNTLFVERALPTDIAPNRDVGVQLAGDVAEGVFSYAAAIQNGVLDGASADLATSDARDAAVRGFLRPFRKTNGPLRGLGLGMAATFGRQQGALPVYKTPGQVTFFSYVSGATADGHRTRLSPQANFYAGPVGVIVEYAQSTQRVRKDPVAADVTNRAWQVAGSWLITGDRASATWVTPRRPFDPAKGQWGAFELAARAHQLTVGQDAFDQGLADIKKSARKATAWGVDLNWYVTRNVRYTVNFEQTKFEGGAATGNRETETMIFFRAQLAF